MTRADRYLIIGILIIALMSVVLFFRHSFLPQSRVSSSLACVKVHGRLVKRINLLAQEAKETFTLQGTMGSAIVEVENNRIRMSDAPCPDRICVGRGWISEPGESIVCIPNEINIYIENGDEIDAVTR